MLKAASQAPECQSTEIKNAYIKLENKATIAAKIVGMAQYIVMPKDLINGRDNSGSHLNDSGAKTLVKENRRRPR